VSYLVLGLVRMVGPATPYDLKRHVQTSIGQFWPFPHTQLYSEPERLAGLGLLEEEREDGGRRRRHYTLTEAGARQLKEWLAVPADAATEYRDLALLQAFFGEYAAPEDRLALARAQIAAHHARIDLLEAARRRFGPRPELALRMRTADLGVRYARVAAEFWEGVVREEERALADGDPRGDSESDRPAA
jgi:DNA-binding PadR family transcriptional regulator